MELLKVVVSTDDGPVRHSFDFTAVVGYEVNPPVDTVAVAPGCVREQPRFFRKGDPFAGE